jgi:hypothetical protein
MLRCLNRLVTVFPVGYRLIGQVLLSAVLRIKFIFTIYAPKIYKASCVMFLMWAASITRVVGGGWALEIENFLGPVKWHRADRRVPFGAQQNSN